MSSEMSSELTRKWTGFWSKIGGLVDEVAGIVQTHEFSASSRVRKGEKLEIETGRVTFTGCYMTITGHFVAVAVRYVTITIPFMAVATCFVNITTRSMAIMSSSAVVNNRAVLQPSSLLASSSAAFALPINHPSAVILTPGFSVLFQCLNLFQHRVEHSTHLHRTIE